MVSGPSTFPRKPIRLYPIHTVFLTKKEAQWRPHSKERGLHCENLMNNHINRTGQHHHQLRYSGHIDRVQAAVEEFPFVISWLQ